MASIEVQRVTLRLLAAEGRALLSRMRTNASKSSKAAHDLSNTLVAAETVSIYGEVEGIEYEPLLSKMIRELLDCAEELGKAKKV